LVHLGDNLRAGNNKKLTLFSDLVALFPMPVHEGASSADIESPQLVPFSHVAVMALERRWLGRRQNRVVAAWATMLLARARRKFLASRLMNYSVPGFAAIWTHGYACSVAALKLLQKAGS